MNDKGTFRKKKGFTIAGNTLVRDSSVSLKAKGLYLLIMSYISIDDLALTKGFLQGKCNEGEKAFCSAWDELKEKGYLKIYMSPSNPGWKAEYELLEEPLHGPHTFYLSADGKVVSDNEKKYHKPEKEQTEPENTQRESVKSESAEPQNADDMRTPQNGGYAAENSRTPQNGTYAKGTYAYGTYANGGYNIILSRKTPGNTPSKTSSPSTPHTEPRRTDKKNLEDLFEKIGISDSPYCDILKPVISDLWTSKRVGATTYTRAEIEKALTALSAEQLSEVVEKYTRQLKKGGISMPGEYLKALILREPQEVALREKLNGKSPEPEPSPSYDIDEYIRYSLAKLNG